MSLIRKECVTFDDLFDSVSALIASASVETDVCLHLPIAFRKILFMDETLGSESLGQIPSSSSFSRISQANREPFNCLYSLILSITAGVETRGLLPPENLGVGH